MPEDLAGLINRLSPGALTTFKRQLAGLPEGERQRAFSKLADVPELQDIIGTPMSAITPAQEPRPATASTSQEAPLWQKALSTATAPFRWIEENITQPFGAVVTAPWTPSVPGTEGKSWFQRELEEYRAWDDPNLSFLGVKGVLEFLPWLAPTIATGGLAGGGWLAGRAGLAAVARGLGTAAKGARAFESAGAMQAALSKAGGIGGAAAQALKPLAAAERAIAYPITKPLEILRKRALPEAIWKKLSEAGRVGLAKEVGISEKAASKLWKGLGKEEKKAISDRLLTPMEEIIAGETELGIQKVEEVLSRYTGPRWTKKKVGVPGAAARDEILSARLPTVLNEFTQKLSAEVKIPINYVNKSWRKSAYSTSYKQDYIEIGTKGIPRDVDPANFVKVITLHEAGHLKGFVRPRALLAEKLAAEKEGWKYVIRNAPEYGADVTGMTKYIKQLHPEYEPGAVLAQFIKPTVSRSVSRYHSIHKGSTFELTGKNLIGEDLYSIGAYPERSVTISRQKLTKADIDEFAFRNSDLLEEPRHVIGTWFDEAEGVSVLDVAITRPNLSSAMELAREKGQKAIYYLKTGEEISVIATGRKFVATGYRAPRAAGAPAVDEGLAGKGQSWTTDKAYAKTYGKDVQEAVVTLENPFVIRTQAEWNEFAGKTAALRVEAAAKGLIGRESEDWVQQTIRNELEAIGHDGVVIEAGLVEKGRQINVFHPEKAVGKPPVGEVPPPPPTKLGEPPTPPPPIKPPVATMAVPDGFSEPEWEAVSSITNLFKKESQLIKETRALRKPVRAARIEQWSATLEAKVAEGVPVKEATWIAKEALKGKYPIAELTPEMRALLEKTAQYEEKLFGVVFRADYASEFTRLNTFTALQKMLLLENVAQHELRLLEETFGSGLVRELLNLRPWGKKVLDFTVDLANAPRALLASCDISGLLRQGAILTARSPIQGVQTVKPMLQALFSDRNAVFVDNIIRGRAGMGELLDPALRVTLDLTSLPSREIAMLTQYEEAFASWIMNKLPFIRASNRAYVTVLNDLRSRSALNVLNNWKKAGIKYTKDDLADLNQLINWASGRGTLPSAIRKQGKLLNAFMFAPKLQFSRIQFPLSILPSVTKSKLVRREAWRELLTFIGAGAGILTMAQLSGAAKVELDPRSTDFGKMQVGDTRLDIWAGYIQYMRFIANLTTAQKKSVGGRIYMANRKETVDRFVRTKFSPAVGLLSDLIEGETYMGEDMPPKSTKGIAGQVYERMMPMAIQDMIDGVQQEGLLGGIWSSTSLLGIGVVTYTDEVSKAREKAAKEAYGISWDELGTMQGRAAQLKLEQVAPTILEAEKEQEKRFAIGTPTLMEQWQNEGQAVEDTYRDSIGKAVKEYQATRNGVLFRAKVDDAAKYRRTAYASRAKRQEYQDIVAYYQQPLEPERLAEMNPGDVIRREYYQEMFSPTMYDEFDNYRFEEAERIEQEFVKRYGQQALDYIEEYRGSRWLDKPVELRLLEQARDVLRPYWKVADAIWSMYPPELKALADQIMVLERTDPTLAKQALRKYPQILRARELIAKYRRQMKATNPHILQAYRLFYGY